MFATPGLTRIRSLAVASEHTFGQASGASTSSSSSSSDPASIWTRIPAEEINFQPTREFLERQVQMPSLARPPGVLGAKGGTLSFKVGLTGADGGPPGHPLRYVPDFLRILFRAAGLVQLSDEDNGTIRDVFQVTLFDSSPESLTISPGVAAEIGDTLHGGLPIAAWVNGRLEVRSISDVSVDVGGPTVVTVFPPFSAAPETDLGARLPAMFIVKPTFDTDESGGVVSSRSASFWFRGDGYEYHLQGCRAAPPKLTVTTRGRVLLEFSFQIDNWESEGLPGEMPPLILPPPIVAQASTFIFVPQMSSPYTEPRFVPVTDISFDFGATLSPINSVTGKNGRIGFAITDVKPVMSFKPYYDWRFGNEFENGGLHGITVQLGTDPGATAVVGMLNGQIEAYPSIADLGGYVGQEVKVQAVAGLQDEEDTDLIAYYALM